MTHFAFSSKPGSSKPGSSKPGSSKPGSSIAGGAAGFGRYTVLAALAWAVFGLPPVLAQDDAPASAESPPAEAAAEPEAEVAASPTVAVTVDEIDPAAEAARAAIERAATGTHRTAERRARDRYRHPVETLTWLGLRPDMTVVEIWPGGGWYTDILAPVLKDQGKLYLANPDTESSIPLFDRISFLQTGADRIRQRIEANPDIFGDVGLTTASPDAGFALAPDGTADMVLTFRNVHNWMAGDYAGDMFAAMFRALKPGGILGLVEHRGDPAKPQDPKASTGYVTEAHIISLAEGAGFALLDGTGINDNPLDTKDYEAGVWTLPPTLARGEENRERYLGIGESDRATLKFVKPADGT